MRIKNLQKHLSGKNIDLCLFFSLGDKGNTNIIYLTGYSGIGLLAVTKKDSFLIVPEMEYEKAKKTGIKTHSSEKKKKIMEKLSEVLSKTKIKKTAIEEDACTVRMYKKIKKMIKGRFLDIGKTMAVIRMKKEEEELKKIEFACGVTDRVFSKICENFYFENEKELRDFIEDEIKKEGCELAFEPIVASGKGTSQPHYDKKDKIKPGFLMLDFGARYKGYCSDMTRMLYVGKPKKKELVMYGLVLNTLLVCEDSVLQKKRFSDIYKISLNALGDYSSYFTHALGHGLGLDIHEAPSLNEEDKNKIGENIPFTIEPGVYFEGSFGIRVEDTVVIKGRSLKILTKSSKELVTINRNKSIT